MDEEKDEIVPGCNRGLHVRKRRHVYFDEARRRRFLRHLAGTCNVQASAAAAGVAVSTVYANRMRHADFRAGWQAALEQGYARLEAALLERALKAVGAAGMEAETEALAGESKAPERIGWDKAMDLLRHHQRGLTGRTPDNRVRPQRVPIEQVANKLIRKLKALGVRPPGACL